MELLLPNLQAISPLTAGLRGSSQVAHMILHMRAGTLTLLVANTCLPAASFVAVAPLGISRFVPTTPIPVRELWRRKVDSPVFQLASGFQEGMSSRSRKAQETAVPQRPQGRALLSMGEDNAPLDRRDLVRVVGAALASFATASTVVGGGSGGGNPLPASAAVLGSTVVTRRPASKRAPPFLCDDSVSYLQNPTTQSEVWIVGTAHISNSSAQLVENVIRNIKPQVVMVELDAQRIGGFLKEEKQIDAGAQTDQGEGAAVSSKDEKPRSPRKKATPFFETFFKQMLDPNVSVNDRITEFFAAALGKAISKMYDNMDQKGLASGQEFTIAIREARSCGAKVLLGDRDVQVTLRRLSQALRSTDLEELAKSSQDELGLGLEALEGGSAESITSNLERLKQRDTMRKVTDFYKKEAPELYSAMIGERDKVMAVNLMTLEGKKTTVAVVGLAHVDGIEAILAANGWKPQRC